MTPAVSLVEADCGKCKGRGHRETRGGWHIPCYPCHGTGKVRRPCNRCFGLGTIQTETSGSLRTFIPTPCPECSGGNIPPESRGDRR